MRFSLAHKAMNTPLSALLAMATWMLSAQAQDPVPPNVRQSTTGRCSPAVVAGASVTITCSELSPAEIALLQGLGTRLDELLQQRAELTAVLSRVDGKTDRILEAVIAIQRDVAHRNGLTLPRYVTELQTFGNTVLPLSIGQSRKLAMSSEEIDRVFAIASVFLSPCDLKLERDGRVVVVDVDRLSSRSSWTRLLANELNVQIVQSIEWCNQPTFGLLGCSEVNGTRAVLADSSQRYGIMGLSLAHELGHLAGISHRASSAQNLSPLMNRVLDVGSASLSSFPEVTPAECQSLVGLAARLRSRHSPK